MNYFQKNSARTLKSFEVFHEMISGGWYLPKLLLVMAPQNHFIQLAKWFWGRQSACEMILEAQHSSLGNDFGGLKVNDFEGWEVPKWNMRPKWFWKNQRSKFWIVKKKDFEKWFSDTYSTSKIISQGWGDFLPTAM